MRTSGVADRQAGTGSSRPDSRSQGAPRDVARRVFDAVGGQSSTGTAILRAAIALVLVAAVLLRFVTRSQMWLDEALTVDIARRPLAQLPGLLRHDGAPPLFYVLLHYWMKLFGQGNLGARSLSGVIGVVNLPMMWLAGYRIGARWWAAPSEDPGDQAERDHRGRVVAWAATLLLAVSPFAVYYDTEARMYGLVILLGTVAVVAFTSVLRRPGPWPAVGLGLVVAALLYSHYWSLYACLVVGAGTLWRAVRGPRRRSAAYALGGLVLGGLAFVPWLPTFLFQVRHTGTPWAAPSGFTAIVFTITQFAGGNSVPGRALALVFFFLVVLALGGAALDDRRVVLDLRTRPGVRALFLVVFLTLLCAVVAGRISGSTFDVRYTSLVVAPALIVVAYGLTTLADPRVRNGLIALAVVLGLAAAAPNAVASRTEAGTVGAAILAGARQGDVIAYCPDQLGPAVSRMIGGRFTELTFPRATRPEIVDWVDYLRVVRAARPSTFAARIEALAGAHTIYYVWAPSYVGFGTDCQVIADAFAAHRTQQVLVNDVGSGAPFEVFEGETLDRYAAR